MRKRRVALLVNMISPARIPIYSGLAEHFDLLILHGGVERNRDSWTGIEDIVPNARIVQAWGWQFAVPRREQGLVFDWRYVHITPGYIQHLLSFAPDAVITGEMGLRTMMALAYGSLVRKPVWIWWGGTLHTERRLGMARRITRAAIRRWARRWISYGNSSTEYLRSLGVTGDRIVQIQNGVDEHLFSPDAPPAFAISPRPVLLYVGQFTMRKGVESLLGAAAALQQGGFEFSLLLVGSGPDGAVLQQLADTVKLRNVHFFPSRRPAEMPSVYCSADALVFPTLEDVWGLVANEAMLCGLPVLCSKLAGCADELFPPQNIFDPRDANEFKSKLREAIEGRLPKPDRSRLTPTSQTLTQLIGALDMSMNAPASKLPDSRREQLYEP